MADDKQKDVPEREGDVLGLGDTRVPQTEADRELAADAKMDPAARTRRRRADDHAGTDETARPEEDGDDPRGLHVKG